MANKRYVNERILKTLFIVMFIAIGTSALFIVTSNGVLSQWVISPTPTAIIIKPSFGIVTLAPTPTIVPSIIGRITPTPTATKTPIQVPVDPSVIADLENGTYTDSPLLYAVCNNSVYVIESDTNKVIDIIHFNKSIQLFDAAVSPDYKMLYVLYYDSPKEFHLGGDTPYDEQKAYFYIATVDLKTDQVVDTSKNHGGTANGIWGRPVKMLMAKDGAFVYTVVYDHTWSAIYRYDVKSNGFNGVVYVNDLDIIEGSGSQVSDVVLSPDGHYLYFSDSHDYTFGRFTVPDLGQYRVWGMDAEHYNNKEPYITGIAVSPDGGTVYLTNYDFSNRSIDIVTLESFAWMYGTGFTKVPTANRPYRIELSADGKRIHALAPDAKTVDSFVINGNSLALDASYGTGNEPIDVALAPDGWSFYVLNAGDSTVTALDILHKVPFGQSPIKVGPKPRSLTMGPQPTGPVWVNKSHNIVNLVDSHAGTVNPSIGGLPAYNNSSVGKGRGFEILANGTLRPITIVNETIVTVPGKVTVTPAAAASAPGNTSRPASTPGFEGIAGALCLAGVMALAGRKYR